MHPKAPLGYAAAAGCALVWAFYSVMNRRYARVSSEPLVTVCASVALLAWLSHLLIEPSSIWPSAIEWTWITVIGIGPVGIAFLAWDHGTKHGNLPLLSTLAYATPILSTLLLLATGVEQSSSKLLLAGIMAASGGWIARSR